MLLLSLSATLAGKAQSVADSIKEVHILNAALLNPRIRQFSITHEEQATGNIHSKLYGQNYFQGRFRMSRTTIRMHVPIMDRKKDNLTFALGVAHQFFYLDDVDNLKEAGQVAPINTYIPMITNTLTYIHRDKLFGRDFNFVGSLGGVFNPSYTMSQFTFTGVITTPLIRNANTSLVGGVVIMVDPSSPAPAFLMLNYYHHFSRSNVDLIVDLPNRINVRKPIGNKFSVALNSDLVGSNSFFEFKHDDPTIPQKITFSSLEIKSGLQLEYRFTKRTIFTINTGVNNTLKSRILENNAKPDNYFISNKNSAVPYVQVGLSIMPFWKGLNL